MISSNYKLRITLLSCLILVLHSNSAFSEWRSRFNELPGLTDKEFLIFTGISASALIVPLFIRLPKPELRLRKSELNGLRLGTNTTYFNILKSYTRPLMIRAKGATKYGILSSLNKQKIVIETRIDSSAFPLDQVKEIMDLKSAARRNARKRIRRGIFYSIVAASSFYSSTVENSPLEGGSRTLSWASFGADAVLAFYSFLHKTKEEKEYRIWNKEFYQETPTYPPVIATSGNKGFKIGVNLASVGGDLQNTSTKFGLVFGGYFAHTFSEKVAIQPEILISMKGYEQGTNFSLSINYLEVPVLTRILLPIQSNIEPSFVIGPSFGLRLTSKGNLNGQTGNFDGIKTTDVGLSLGFSGKIGNFPAVFDIRYTLGLQSIADSNFGFGTETTANVKSKVISLMIGLRP